MARRARLNVPGGIFHVVSRFARDEWRLDQAGARATYLEYLAAAAETSGVKVLAYCLMSNHVHVVVQQGDRSLERFTKSLHTGFAAWSADRAVSKAKGPIFAQRPRMVLVERDAHLLELVRYVHNNPVRAGVARFARSSGWSSHQAYLAKTERPAWLHSEVVLSLLGKDPRRAAERFDAFVDEGRKQRRRPELSGAANTTEAAAVRHELGDGHRLSDGVFGSPTFVERIRRDRERFAATFAARGAERRAGRSERPKVRALIDAVLDHSETDARELVIRPRSRLSARVKRLAVWTWVHEYAGSQIEIARALDLDTSVVSRYYGQAAAASGEFDEAASAVIARLDRGARTRKKSGTGSTASSADAIRVRYHVDVDET